MLLQHPIEEETLPDYRSEDYYPVNIGEVFVDRYEVVGKLGYGSNSTSWLCRDRETNSFRTVKVSICLKNFPEAATREITAYKHIASVALRSKHPGRHLIRSMYDDFILHTATGEHHALVLSPMYMTMLDRARQYPNALLPLADARKLVRNMLWVLDFLHAEAGVVHADLKTDNLMLTIEDGGMLSDFVRDETAQPSRRREGQDGRGIYRSRGFRPPRPGMGFGTPVLCDFGESRIGTVQSPERGVQPMVYRAPEVIFEMAWGCAADIWNLAGLVWELVQGERLFRNITDVSGTHSAFRHVARMVALLGKPPSMFLQRSRSTAQCFEPDGAWIADTEAQVPAVCLESLEQRYAEIRRTAEDKAAVDAERDAFLDFVRAMLQ
ncbi:hypothetical protein TD95_001956, partial [Thielaviopsis punctulata]